MDLNVDQLAAVRAVSAPGMTPGAGATRYLYNREPYGRARISTALGELVVDGKVLMTERGPFVQFWRDCGVLGVSDVLVPGAWVQPFFGISRLGGTGMTSLMTSHIQTSRQF